MSHIPTRPRSIRRYLRFSLRTFLIVATLLSAGFGWLAMRVGVVRRERAAVEALGHCQVFYDYQRQSPDDPSQERIEELLHSSSGIPAWSYFEKHGYDEYATPPGPVWLRKWFGSDILANVTFIEIADDYGPVAGSKSWAFRRPDLAPLSQLASLEEIVFTTHITPDDLKYLLDLQNPKVLVLRGFSLGSENDLAELAPHGNLQRLVAAGGGFTGKELRIFGRVHSLRHLSLAETEISDEDMPFLRQLTALETLSLRETAIGDQGIAACAEMTQLKLIDLTLASVRGIGFDDLRRLTSLSVLKLAGSQVDDVGLESVGRLTSLVELDLAGTKITDVGLVHLAGLKNLRKLDLGANRISGSGLAALSGLTKLRRLDLDSTGVGDRDLIQLSRLSQLEHLGLNSTRVTDAGLVHLRGLSKIEVLELAETEVSNAGLQDLHSLPSLRQVDLYHTDVTYDGLTSMRQRLKLQVGARRQSLVAPPLPAVDWSQPDDEEEE